MDLAKHEFKEVNGLILRILQSRGFEYVTDRAVDACLKEVQKTCVLRNVQEHFLYLAGKGKEYIEVTNVKLDEKEMMARLTPRGIDLLYGVIDNDPGISVVYGPLSR